MEQAFSLLLAAGPLIAILGLIWPRPFGGSRAGGLAIGLGMAIVGGIGGYAVLPEAEKNRLRQEREVARAAHDAQRARDAAVREAQEAEDRRRQEAQRQAEADARARLDACRPVGPNDATPLGGYACPGDQRRFAEVIRSFRASFTNENNQIRQAELRADRARQLCQILLSGWVQDWRGTLRAMALTERGRVALSVELEGVASTAFETSGAGTSRLADATQVRPDTETYAVLRTLSSGQRVIFSGEIIKGPADCGLGTRETDVQMMLGPRFYFRFTEVRAAD